MITYFRDEFREPRIFAERTGIVNEFTTTLSQFDYYEFYRDNDARVVICKHCYLCDGSMWRLQLRSRVWRQITTDKCFTWCSTTTTVTIPARTNFFLTKSVVEQAREIDGDVVNEFETFVRRLRSRPKFSVLNKR